MLTTASKKNLLTPSDLQIAVQSMTQLNKIGADLGQIEGVHAMTDVTGFGLAGHLIEMADGSNLTAEVEFSKLPILSCANNYMELGCVPGGTNRNWKSYGEYVNPIDEKQRLMIADPQTSGGLLISVGEGSVQQVLDTFKHHNIDTKHFVPFGRMTIGGEKK